MAVQMRMVCRIDDVLPEGPAEEEPLGTMVGEPVRIHLREDAQPYSVSSARRIALPLLPAVKREVQRMLDSDIIEPVTTPSDWCAPIVPVVKKGSGDGGEPKVRLCIDFKKLNHAIKRETYQLPTVDELIPRLAGAKMFSVLDASSGFWQLPLHKDSRHLTCFITPFGRFRMKRLPFGISIAPEVYQRRMNLLLEGIEGVACYMDDVLVFGASEEEHDKNLKQVLKRMKSEGLTLNQSKCHLRQKRLKYLGHIVSEDGVEVDPAKVAAIQALKRPSNVKEVKQLLGMVNYVGRFIPQLAETLRPLNDLLRRDHHWTWDVPQEQALEAVKRLVSEAPVLAIFDPNLPTVLAADASSYGMGGALFQDHGDAGLRPIAFCSRTLSSCEQHYAQIEKECLAITHACEKFHRYVHGLRKFTVLTDHKPLIPLLNSKDIDLAPVRCQRMLLRLMRYGFVAEHCPGKQMVVSDLLSRQPLDVDSGDTRHEEPGDLEEEVQLYVDAVVSGVLEDAKLEEVKSAQEGDPVLRKVAEVTEKGWPATATEPEVEKFRSLQDSLSVVSGVLCYGSRILIPESMKRDVLKRIHAGHIGLNKSRQVARESVFWPRLSEDLKNFIEGCDFCQAQRPRQRSEPLIPTPLPESPWRKLGADILEHKGKSYLVIVDYYSRYPEILQLSSITSEQVILKMQSVFARFGLPCELVTDGGTQFTSALFQEFSRECGFVHTVTSPHFPQANGEAERAVRTAKHLLKQPDPWMALLAYRAAPLHTLGLSPAELLMGRKLRTTVPMLPQKFRRPDDEVRRADERLKMKDCLWRSPSPEISSPAQRYV
ncbi:uncharacterized protein K02A2.6-like [Amphibalanus amphitrite]|uniref:uncharacterized protein K02A2.6-like n=1 Tax=Amphibalanus amphitrite TaxID=1232801 RepID=UPI001C921302|nr:uncharacterized protein K02A2.6-like [Amphibalanus amphitrite]